MATMQASPQGRYVVPAFAGIYSNCESMVWPMIRFFTGAWFVPHGWQKLVDGQVTGTAGFLARSFGGVPQDQAAAAAGDWMWLAYYLGALELVGGALLAVGFLTRIVAIQFVGFMTVAVFAVHWANGFFWTKGGWEYPALWGILALAAVIHGGGKWSVDRAIGREI